jgi:hypothetical protein
MAVRSEKKTTLADRLKHKVDGMMAGPLGMSPQSRRMVYHYSSMLMEQLKAMLPITLLQASAAASSHIPDIQTSIPRTICYHNGFSNVCSSSTNT